MAAVRECPGGAGLEANSHIRFPFYSGDCTPAISSINFSTSPICSSCKCVARPGVQPVTMSPKPMKIVCMAKKKGGGGKKGSSGGGREASFPLGASAATVAPPYTQADVIMHSLSIVDSYFRACGRPIFSEAVEISEASRKLWEAPFAVVSMGTEGDGDPELDYGNQAALSLYELSWDKLSGSRASILSDVDDWEKRKAALQNSVQEAQSLEGRLGVTSTGRKFVIKEGVVWNLTSVEGEVYGKVELLFLWEFEGEETTDDAQGLPEAATAADSVPSPEAAALPVDVNAAAGSA